MTPIFLSEAIIQTFVFYRDGKLYRGLFSKGQFFKLVRYFKASMREQAFNLAWDLGNRQWAVAITASPQSYGVWVDIAEDIDCDCVHLLPARCSDNISDSITTHALMNECLDSDMDVITSDTGSNVTNDYLLVGSV